MASRTEVERRFPGCGARSSVVALCALSGLVSAGTLLRGSTASAELPAGYLVWTRGQALAPQTRRIYRMTLPAKTDAIALTSGEDIEAQISPDGRWVAYAKAKLPGSDYHDFGLWSLYLVSIHGVEQGHEEIEIDADGYWPSWGADGALYYNQVDGKHSRIVRAVLDDSGRVASRSTLLSTRDAFAEIDQVNECYLSPDATWFAARTRGVSSVNGVGAFAIDPPAYEPLARAGSVGCMPVVAPSGRWALIAGASYGLRWGHAPGVPDRQVDQLLVEPPTAQHKAYHPGISTDEQWVAVAYGTDQNHNDGPYDLYLYRLDAGQMAVSDEQLLVGGGFNGWPHLWVGESLSVSFSPSSYTLVRGESVTLVWNARSADRVTLDGELVAVAGDRTVTPEQTTTYQLVAESSLSGDRAARTVEVVVHAEPRPVVIERFEVTPDKVTDGESATLGWRVRNPTTLTVAGEAAPPHGSLEVTVELTPDRVVEYVLEARGHQGPVQRTVVVRVRPRPSLEPLADRGGFVCALRHNDRAPVGLLVLLALAAALRWRGWRRG